MKVEELQSADIGRRATSSLLAFRRDETTWLDGTPEQGLVETVR